METETLELSSLDVNLRSVRDTARCSDVNRSRAIAVALSRKSRHLHRVFRVRLQSGNVQRQNSLADVSANRLVQQRTPLDDDNSISSP